MQKSKFTPMAALCLWALSGAGTVFGQEVSQAAPGAPAAVKKRVSDPQAVAIVENYLKVVGGKESLAKVTDRVTSFRNVKYQSTGETVAEISLYMKDDLDRTSPMIREEWDIKGFDIKGKPLAFVQIYNGALEEAWVQMLGTVSELEGKTLNVFVWDKHIDDFFCTWEEAGYTLTLDGQGLVEEQPCDIVKVTDFSGRQNIRFFFSRETGLLVKKEWRDDAANAKQPVKREQYYKKYRDLSFMDSSGLAIKFPLLLEIYADGDLDTERQFTNVRFNSQVADALFQRPEGTPFPEFQRQMKEKEQLEKAKQAIGGTPTSAHPAVGESKAKAKGSATKRRGKSGVRVTPKTTDEPQEDEPEEDEPEEDDATPESSEAP